jgi:hypothetical protein
MQFVVHSVEPHVYNEWLLPEITGIAPERQEHSRDTSFISGGSV